MQRHNQKMIKVKVETKVDAIERNETMPEDNGPERDTKPRSGKTNHMNNLILINPDGKYVGFFRPSFEPERMSIVYQSVTSQTSR